MLKLSCLMDQSGEGGDYEITFLVRNLFNQHYYAFGTFFETGAIPYLNLTDPRTFIPGMPLAAYAGVRARF